MLQMIFDDKSCRLFEDKGIYGILFAGKATF
jgi:hypothetical protein